MATTVHTLLPVIFPEALCPPGPIARVLSVHADGVEVLSPEATPEAAPMAAEVSRAARVVSEAVVSTNLAAL
jgi:hypothetical protein